MPRREIIVGVILAGGRSSRMGGGDKGLLPLAGQPMLRRVVDRLRPQVSEIVLNANGAPGRFATIGLPVVEDAGPGFAGPLAGVLAGMTWARDMDPEARFIATASSDSPFFPADLVERFRAAVGVRYPAIAIARSADGLQPVFGLWPTALADDLAEALADGVRKVLHWTDRHDAVMVDFPPTTVGAQAIDPFFNANTREELAEAEALLLKAGA